MTTHRVPDPPAAPPGINYIVEVNGRIAEQGVGDGYEYGYDSPVKCALRAGGALAAAGGHVRAHTYLRGRYAESWEWHR